MKINNPKKMLLFGPGYGHNTEAKLDSLKDTTLFNVDFIAYNLDETFIDKYPYINFIPSKFELRKKHLLKSIKSVIWLYKQVRSGCHYDIAYSLGVEGFMGALFFFSVKKETKKALEIWNVAIVRLAKNNKSLYEKFDRYIINRVDFVCQYWWGIRELFIDAFPKFENKFLMYPLTYRDIFFSDEKHTPQSEFVKHFLDRIPEEQIVCFWPRSFIPSNNHHLLMESLGVLKNDKPQMLNNFKLYLWGGNVRNEAVFNQMVEDINNYKLLDNVEIVDHPYVPQNDIFAIEERSDFFVQITKDDILSTFIMEILCSGKPFVLSNNRTFQFLNEIYHLNVPLVENSPHVIADSIAKILNGEYEICKEDMIERKEKCKNLFSQSTNKSSSETLYEKL